MAARLIRIRTENADFQFLETLRRNRTKRSRSGLFFVEGVRAINQALSYGWPFQALAFTRETRLSDWAESILTAAQPAIHYELPAALLEKISQKESPSELIAVLPIPADDLTRIQCRSVPLVVVLDRIMSPGNLGTLIRSCDALSVDGIVLCGHAADLYAPETIRATTGSFFAQPVVRIASPNDLSPWFERLRRAFQDMQVVGTSAGAQISLDAHDFTRPTVLLIGNENHGLSQKFKGMADQMVTIPMQGSASSMNVACAASIVLYEIARQRQ